MPRVIAGRYELLGEIGRGGMGVVYRARDTRLRRQVALKLVAPLVAADEDLRARFVREAHTLARVRDPGVVAVHDVGVEDEQPWLVMDLCEEGSLADWLEKGPLDHKETRALLVEIASALSAIHEAGVVHRDLKPANILRDSGRWLVGDFGIAAAGGESTITRTGIVMGTPEYWAPEVMREDLPVGPKADVYSLGCVLYHAWTGRPPFVGENPLAIGMRHVSEPPPEIPQEVRSKDPDLARLVARMLEKDPSARPSLATLGARRVASVDEADATTRRMEEPGPSRTPTEPLSARRSRWRQILVALALVAAAIVAGAAFLLVGSGSSGDGGADERPTTSSPPPPPAPALRTPELVGLTAAQARRSISQEAKAVGAAAPSIEAGAARYSDSRRRGRIIEQSPRPDRFVKAGGTVAVTLSKGPATTTVPEIAEGTALGEAQGSLRTQGFGVRVTGEPSGSVARGAVLRTDPPAGSRVTRPTAVTLVVSTGPRKEPVAAGVVGAGDLRPDGLAEIDVGDSAAEMVGAWGPYTVPEEGISIVEYKALGIQVTLDSRRATVAEFWISEGDWHTPSGARLGSSLSELRSIYGSELEPVAVRPGYDANGTTENHLVAAGSMAVGFIMGDGRVSIIVSGPVSRVRAWLASNGVF